MSRNRIVPKENAKDLWDVNEDVAISALLYAHHEEETPVPWDAYIEVNGNIVTIRGSIIGGSSNTPEAAGYCECRISVDKFPKVYYIEVGDIEDEATIEELEAAGWSVLK